MTAFFLLLVLCAHSSRSAIIVDPSTSIINGDLASIEDYPFFAYITLDKKFHCGGAIVKENLILTAAHCLNREYEKLTVYVGIDSVEQLPDATPYKVQKKIPHPEYMEEFESAYDIGFALLEENILFDGNKVAVAVLANKSPPIGTEVAVIGFGKIQCDLRLNACPNDNSDRLRRATVRISRIDDDGVIYTKGNGQNTCEGDSGSPVVYDGKIIGVVSKGDNINCSGYDHQAPIAPRLSWCRRYIQS